MSKVVEERRGRRVLPVVEAPAVECCAPIAAPDVSDDQARASAAVFRALGDPHRVRIVNLLANADQPVCVCDLQETLGLAQGTVSFHLKKLVAAGLLHRVRRGTWSYYSLDRRALGSLADVFTL
jgi:ArsR family transcriptional regulator